LDLRDAEAQIIIEVGHQYRKVGGAQRTGGGASIAGGGDRVAAVTRNRYAQRDALFSDVLKVQSGLADADNRFTQALLDLATAQTDFEKAIGVDQ
jgi:hypothetical protein